jgi:hypothetical protein
MRAHNDRWYWYPIAWLGIGLLTASLLVCVLTIAIATWHADPVLDTGSGAHFLGMPLTEEPARTRPP